ncbi:MAG: glycosyltransferase family 2 protein [Planctomycetota bacterium]
MDITYSVIIPIYNEEGNIEKLTKILYEVLGPPHNYEVIYVDDASTDNSRMLLKKLTTEYLNLQAISLKKRYGQSGALYVGLQHSRGKILITLDGDLQNPPHEIPKLIAELNKGYDFVIGIRKNRQDNWIKKISSKIANWYRKLILGDIFEDIGCSLRAFKREVLNCIFPFKSLHRFLPYLVLINKFKVSQIEIEHHRRVYGKSKYGVFIRAIQGSWDTQAMGWLKNRIIPYKELLDGTNIEFI